ncbi:MAG: ABC transporter ATP-binding protein [Ktedonobacteraceae bacterium]|nr:ABC transporter ATP-binding protein [Ktedonobacteraceae bacterium]
MKGGNVAEPEEKLVIKVPFRYYVSLLRTYLKPQWFKVSLLVLLLFASIGFEILNPQLLGHFIDVIQSGMDTLVGIALLFIGLVIANQLVTALASYMSEDIGWRATNALRIDLTLHCLNLDMSFHKVHTPGELIERVDGDIAMLANFFSRFVFYVFGRVLLLIGIVALTISVDRRVGLLLLAFTMLMAALLRPLQHIAVPHFRAARQVSAEIASFLEERLSSAEDIRSNGAQGYVMFRLNQLARRMLRATRLSSVTGRFYSSAVEISLALAVAAVLTLGAYLLHSGQMSLGTIYVTYYYTTLLTQSMYAITYQINQLQSATASIQRITELYHTPNAIVDGPGGALPAGPLPVRFDDASFGYTPEKTVLQDIAFELHAGKTLGLLGRTGSGKTTLTRLLYRAYDVQRGSIQIGGIDVRQTALSELRSRIGVVTQDVQLFHASIRDNLTFFDAGISDERLERVISDLNLTQWFASLPDGLDTIISGGGIALSSGEAQLLAFARVFLQNPDIVILDEASSRLDPVTEKLIGDAVSRLLAGRTGIVIAHHLETVQLVDEILILEDGRIREHGDRSQLATDPTSRFSQLLKTGLAEVMS